MTLPVYANTTLSFSGVYFTFLLPRFFYQLPVSSQASLPGDYMPGVPPVPIPNTAVKLLSADGTLSQGTGE